MVVIKGLDDVKNSRKIKGQKFFQPDFQPSQAGSAAISR